MNASLESAIRDMAHDLIADGYEHEADALIELLAENRQLRAAALDLVDACGLMGDRGVESSAPKLRVLLRTSK